MASSRRSVEASWWCRTAGSANASSRSLMMRASSSPANDGRSMSKTCASLMRSGGGQGPTVALDQVQVARGDPEALGHLHLAQALSPPQGPDLGAEARKLAICLCHEDALTNLTRLQPVIDNPQRVVLASCFQWLDQFDAAPNCKQREHPRSCRPASPSREPARPAPRLRERADRRGAGLRGRSGPHLRAARGRACSNAAGLAAGEPFDFLPETRTCASATGPWPPLPADLLDRRVEITGPVDRKMIINALNSGANVFMADFEDANCPDLGEPGRRASSTCATPSARHHRATTRPKTGKHYALNDRHGRAHRAPARLAPARDARRASTASPSPGVALRLRALLLPQREGAARARQRARTSTCPRWRATSRRGCGTTCSSRARRRSACRSGTIKATVLIETLPAAFEMDEILYELREHSAGLNCGRWDYIFSFIKKRADDPRRVLPDRGQVTMDKGFLRAYVAAAHQDLPPPRRARDGRHGRADPHQERPRRERGGAGQGARGQAARGEGRPRRHLGRAPGAGARRARRSSTRTCPGPNQLERQARRRERRRARTCSRVPEGTRTEAGLRHNIRVGVQYLEAWLRGQRLRAALQPDGRRRDGGDLARAGLAVAAPRRAARRRAARHAASASTRVVAEEMQRVRERGRRRALRRRPLHRGARRSSCASSTAAAASRTSSPCPPTSSCTTDGQPMLDLARPR